MKLVFMKYPPILYLRRENKNLKIIEIKKNLRPNNVNLNKLKLLFNSLSIFRISDFLYSINYSILFFNTKYKV